MDTLPSFEAPRDISAELPVLQEAPPARPRQRGFTKLSWLIIAGIVGLLIARSNFAEGPTEEAHQDRLQEIVFDLQGRCQIGEAQVIPGERLQIYERAKPFDRGSPGQRLRFVVLAGELAGPREAQNKAKQLEETLQRKGNATEQVVAHLLARLYRDYAAGERGAADLSDMDRELLREELGWYGELALHPPATAPERPVEAALGGAAQVLSGPIPVDTPERLAVLEPALRAIGALLGAVGAGIFMAMLGCAGLAAFIVLLVRRKLRGGLACGSDHGGIYAETFALFLLALGGLSYLAHVLPADIPTLIKGGLVPLTSLMVLGWPVLRGVPWARVRQDIGWTLGRNPALEPIVGIGCYIISLPIVLVGLGLTLVLMAVRNHVGDAFGLVAQQQPIHPIVEFVAHGSALDRVLVFVEACILAPFVEETMFRGVLYRHLRELSHRCGFLCSVVLSGTIASFIFAAIHPQGLLAAPVLMALAYGFTIACEWRGTLLPSMVGHALNNGLVLLFLLLIMGT